MDHITISKDDLRRALRNWIVDSRNGETRPQAEVDTMSIDDVAEESTEGLWNDLVRPAA